MVWIGLGVVVHAGVLWLLWHEAHREREQSPRPRQAQPDRRPQRPADLVRAALLFVRSGGRDQP